MPSNVNKWKIPHLPKVHNILSLNIYIVCCCDPSSTYIIRNCDLLKLKSDLQRLISSSQELSGSPFEEHIPFSNEVTLSSTNSHICFVCFAYVLFRISCLYVDAIIWL